MNKKRLRLVLVIGGIIFLIIAIPLFVSAKALVPEQDCARLIAEDGRGISICLDVLETSTPPTDVAPTDTPTPPTDTPVASTATPEGPWAGSLPCPSHDNRAYHGLFDYERGCHYNHEHKDDPRELDDVFGTGFYDLAGGELSYPWQTFRGTGENYPAPPLPGNFENDFKHEGYGWIVRRGGSDEHRFEKILDLRIQIHAVMAPEGATTRFHSFYVEARVKNPDNSIGYIRTGGWVDFCHLQVTNQMGEETDIIFPGDCDPIPDFPAKRQHSDSTPGLTWYGGNAPRRHGFAAFYIRSHDTWAPVNPDDPSELVFFCPDFDCENNGSTLMLLELSMNIIPGSGGINLDPDYDGLLNYSGYTDRYGIVIEGCTEPGLDCVPLELENVTTSIFAFMGSELREYDISPPNEFWIAYPN